MRDLIAFSLGVAVGSVVTWKLVDKKYKDLADEEINNVKEHFKSKLENEETKVEYEDNVAIYTTPEKEVYVSPAPKDRKEKKTFNKEAKVISPESYGENGYETKSYTYYANNVLVDLETKKQIKDPEKILGDALEHFGDYGEDDSVYVRDDKLKYDYEVLKSENNYEG